MRLYINGHEAELDTAETDDSSARYAMVEGKLTLEIMRIETVGELDRMKYDYSISLDLLDLVEFELDCQGSRRTEKQPVKKSKSGVKLMPTEIQCCLNGEPVYGRIVTDKSIVEIGVVKRHGRSYVLSITAKDSRNSDPDGLLRELRSSDSVSIRVGGSH